MVKKVNKSEDINSRVLDLFLDSPTSKSHVRGVARELGISPRTAKKYLVSLSDGGLLKMEKDGIYEKYRADRDSQAFKDNKVFHTIRKLRESGVIRFLEEEMNYPTLILYGSASRGEDIEDSDVDIFVIVKGKMEGPGLSKYEKRIGKGIQLMLMDEKVFKSGKNAELINNVMNGIVLSGFLEVF